jgi:protein tyrosine phosphatase (PTP) superfamily phosphohydrolase (DUF442 family)
MRARAISLVPQSWCWYTAATMTDMPRRPEPASPALAAAAADPAAGPRWPVPTDRWTRPLAGPRDRLAAWADMLFADHGLVRLVYPNRHRVTSDVWRSGQPLPGQLRAFAQAGGRTVVSLRAGRGFGSLPLEIETCRAVGLGFRVLVLRSGVLPSRDELRAAARLFREMERPALLHCKSGADRSGFAAALYLMLAEDRPVAEARRQLALRYGHRPWGRAGILDAFFDVFERDTAAAPRTLLDWVETHYDPAAITAAFRPKPLGAVLAERLRHRP